MVDFQNLDLLINEDIQNACLLIFRPIENQLAETYMHRVYLVQLIFNRSKD